MPPVFKRLDVPGGVNDDDILSEYDFPKITPLHSMFLRTLISRRSLRETEATTIVLSIIQNYPHSTLSRGNISLTTIEEELNESLHKFGMKLMRTKAEHSGEVFINYVSAGLLDDADASKRAQSKKQANHIASVFHCIWDRLLTDSTSFNKSEFEDMQPKSGVILTRLQTGLVGEGGGNVSKIAMQDWKTSFERLQNEGWIIYSGSTDRIFLGPRATAELKEKIGEAGIQPCSICKKTCISPSPMYLQVKNKRAHVFCAANAPDAITGAKRTDDKEDKDRDEEKEGEEEEEEDKEDDEDEKRQAKATGKKLKR